MQQNDRQQLQFDEAQHLVLDEAWIYKVSVVADAVARRVAKVVLEVSDLSLSQWRVLAAVADRPGCTASQVVDITPMDKAIVSRAAASLVEKSLIVREASQLDGRRSHLQLTDQGQSVYAAIVRNLDRTGASGRTTLSEQDAKALNDLLSQVLNNYPD